MRFSFQLETRGWLGRGRENSYGRLRIKTDNEGFECGNTAKLKLKTAPPDKSDVG